LYPNSDSLILSILPACAFFLAIIFILLMIFVPGVNSCNTDKSILIAPISLLAMLLWHIHKLMFFRRKGLLCINKEGISIPYIAVIRWSEIDKMLLLKYSDLLGRRGGKDFLCVVPKDYEAILSRLKPVRKRDTQYRANFFGIQGIYIYLLGVEDSSVDELCQKIKSFFKPVEKITPTVNLFAD